MTGGRYLRAAWNQRPFAPEIHQTFASSVMMAESEYQEHIGHILCCTCGVQIKPNGANMCADCLKSSVDLSSDLAKHATVVFCKECGRYQKSTQWQSMQLESAELLALCLKRIKGIEKLKLIDAGFVWTEPHSRRLKVKVTVQKDVAALNGVIVQQTFIVELVVTTQQCEDCQRSYTEHIWNSCLQIRQKTDHKRTFLLLEQLILKHGMNQLIMYVQNAPGGLDMFFSSKSRALSMVDFVTSVVPSRSKQSRRLISQDFKNNTANYKHTMLVDIVPICSLDLVCLPKKVAHAAGGLCPLLVCTKVSTMMSFIDPESLKTMELSASRFWAAPFRSLCSSRHLIEYVILDVVPTGVVHGKFAQAEVTCARSSDLSKNDTQFETMTHLGNILKPGDLASGYDLTSMVFNDDDLKSLGSATLPDVVLVKKTFRRKNRAARRKFKLQSLTKADDAEIKVDEDQQAKDEEIFLRELEEDMELRCRVNLFKRDGQQQENVLDVADLAVANSDQDEEDPDFPDVNLDELISNMDHLTHTPVDVPVGDDGDIAELGRKRRNNVG